MASKRGAAVNKKKAAIDQAGALGVLDKATAARAHDVFANVLARTGFGTPNLGEGGSYPLVRFTFNYWDLISMFEGSWLTRRIVELPCKSMVKAWPRLTSDVDPADLTRIDRALRKNNVKGQVLTALTWAKLFGGAGCLICLKGQEKELDQPLNLDDIGVHDFKGLIPFDRWSGIYPDTAMCEDINRPIDFGLPESYEVRPYGGTSFKVHSSRILRFSGPQVPSPEKEAYSGWGISVVEPVLQDIEKYDNISFNILALSFRANILGMKFPDLAAMLSGVSATGAAAQKFEERMAAVNHLISNQSLVPLPKDGSIESTAYSFSGLSEVFQQFQLAVSGAAQIPVSRLWGKTITGLGNGTNEGDEKVYEERIADDQDTDMRPQLEKLYPVVCASELGEVPDDLDFTFPSIRVLDEKERSELAKTVVDTVMVAMNGSVISPRTAAKELKQSSDITGIFTNIADEAIEALSDEVQSEGEVGGDLFGEEGGGLNPSSSPAKAIKEENKKAGKAEQRPEVAEAPGEPVAARNKPVDDGVEGLRELARAADADLRLGVKNCQWCGDALDGDDVAEVNGSVVCPACADAYGRGRAMDVSVGYVAEKCGRPEWRTCPSCGGRIHKNTCGVKLHPDRDCCKERGCQYSLLSAGKGTNQPFIGRAHDEDGPHVGPCRKVHGIDVTVETPKGYERRGKGWSQAMPYDYGYIKGVAGADGDSMDAALGPESNGWVYVIDQRHLGKPGFDEHKCFIGWPSAKAALDAFNQGHHRAKEVFMDWTPMTINEFKQWLRSGDHSKPVGGVPK